MATMAVAVRGGAVAGVREGLISLRRRGERGGYEDKDDGARLDAGLLREASGEALVLRHEQRCMGGGEGHGAQAGMDGSACFRAGSDQRGVDGAPARVDQGGGDLQLMKYREREIVREIQGA